MQVSVKPGKQMMKRIFGVMLAMIILITGVSGFSLINIMIVNGEKYQSMASEQQLYDTLLSAPRGDIYDRNMNLLATSSPAWTVYVTPNSFKSLKEKESEEVREVISEGLADILEMDKEEVYELTCKKTYYVIIKKKIEKEIADKVRKFISDNSDIKLSNYVGLDTTTKRYYPCDTLASTVLGFVGDDEQGLAGLESYYDNELTGVAGRVVAAKNAKGNDMLFTYQKLEEAKQGNSIVTTIDSYIQYTCEKYLDTAVAEEQIAERGAVVVMNVNNGEVYGMAVSGDFDPNSPFTLSAEDQAKVDAAANDEERSKLKSDLLNRQWRNKAVSDTYEPGSVFKIFTASTALEEGLVTANSTFTCNHTYVVAGNPYHCHDNKGGHGTQTLAQAMSNSCNPAFIQIGQLIGNKLFSKYFKAFGLSEKTGIDLPGEATPNYHSEENMGATELASSSFGQTFNITPIHMITLAAAAVNGGYLVQPHIAQRIIDGDKNSVKTISTAYKRQVVSNTTSSNMRTFLEYVVQNGAKNGIVAGYRVGGKTGTSQKVSKILQTGNSRLYIGSYVGIAPIDNPEIAVFVMLDEPMGSRYYGGAISAPVGSKVMADVLPYLGFEPKYTAEELTKLSITVPEVKGVEINSAKQKLTSSGLEYKVIGNGGSVIKQLPEAGTTMYKGGTIILYTEETNEENATVPNLTGLKASDANVAASNAGINIAFSGNTTSPGLISYTQSVPAGTVVPKGTVVTVYFRDEGNADIAVRN